MIMWAFPVLVLIAESVLNQACRGGAPSCALKRPVLYGEGAISVELTRAEGSSGRTGRLPGIARLTAMASPAGCREDLGWWRGCRGAAPSAAAWATSESRSAGDARRAAGQAGQGRRDLADRDRR